MPSVWDYASVYVRVAKPLAIAREVTMAGLDLAVVLSLEPESSS
jgi:hypothetical protein